MSSRERANWRSRGSSCTRSGARTAPGGDLPAVSCAPAGRQTRLLAPRGRLQAHRPHLVRVSLLLPLAWNVLGILTGELLGAPAPSFEGAAELLASPLSIVPFVAVVLLFGPLPEELGWRGYALDGLLERRSALAASLILGAVWALWHWPQFFMQGSYIGEAFPIGSAIFWAGWVLPTVAYSVMYTWIYHHTGRSILSAILFHFAANFWGPRTLIRRPGRAGTV